MATQIAATEIFQRAAPSRLRKLRCARSRRPPPLRIASPGSYGFVLGIENLEDPHDMGEPKNLFHGRAQPEQNEFPFQALRILERLDQCCDSGTIDVPYGRQVESQLG